MTPQCPAFARCGGCVWQNAAATAQLAYKREIVEQALRRIGGFAADLPPVPLPLAAPAALGYRNRVVYHVKQGRFGLFAPHSHRLCEADCLLLRPPLRTLTRALRENWPADPTKTAGLRALSLRCDAAGERALVSFVCEREQSWLKDFAAALRAVLPEPALLHAVWENSGAPVYSVYGADWRLLQGEAIFTDQIGGVSLQLAPADFLQVHHAQAERLYAVVGEWASLQKSDRVLDCYGGVGLPGLLLAPHCAGVTAIESYTPAAASANVNAKINKVDNYRCLPGAVETVLPSLVESGWRPSVAILDPPRAGCAPAALDALCRLAVPRLLYISCDPATLSRDLKLLLAGGYRLQAVQPVDMFPQTPHVETVTLFTRAGAGAAD